MNEDRLIMVHKEPRDTERGETNEPVYVLPSLPVLEDDITIEQRVRVSALVNLASAPKEDMFECMQRLAIYNFKLKNAIQLLLENWPTELDPNDYEPLGVEDDEEEYEFINRVILKEYFDLLNFNIREG